MQTRKHITTQRRGRGAVRPAGRSPKLAFLLAACLGVVLLLGHHFTKERTDEHASSASDASQHSVAPADSLTQSSSHKASDSRGISVM